jgi:dolichyl-phosphate beta-glucosyltransferase
VPRPFLSIVIPAYNEASRLGRTLDLIRHYASGKPFAVEVVVVDDGSSDATPSLVRERAQDWPALRLVVNERNRGKGFSVRRGVLEAEGELVLFTDADLSAPIEEADKLLAALQSSRAIAAIGSRALDRSLIRIRQPKWREYAGRAFNLLVRLITGLPLRDTQCGLKLFRRAAVLPAFRAQRVTGFGFDPEVLFLIRRWGGEVVEVPVRWDNDPATKVRFFRDSLRMLVELGLLRWRAWTGQYDREQARRS